MYLQKVISGKNFSTKFKSGFISQRHGSADPDPDPGPHQNVMDPHCLFDRNFGQLEPQPPGVEKSSPSVNPPPPLHTDGSIEQTLSLARTMLLNIGMVTRKRAGGRGKSPETPPFRLSRMRNELVRSHCERQAGNFV
jgi:hypothetical protein